MYRHILLRFSLFAALGGSALAGEATLQPDVIVTATRFAQTIDDTLANVSVITREDIEASGTRDISDLLRLQAGVDVARTGGAGGQTSVFLRGTNNNNVLVLIDGVRAASLSTGCGPACSRANADAIAGVPVPTKTRRAPAASSWSSTRRNCAARSRHNSQPK